MYIEQGMNEVSQDEKRNNKRTLFTATLEFAYSILNNDRLECLRGKGISVNISDGGLGFYTTQGLTQGQYLALYSSQLDPMRPKMAEVKWCRKQAESIYKIGLAFC